MNHFKKMLPPCVIALGLLLLGSLMGCSDKNTQLTLPQADDVLQLVHAQDTSVVQVKLQQCQVRNLFAGEETSSARNDIYRCQIIVERFDDEYKQFLLKQQLIELRRAHSSIGWELY